MPDFFLDCIHCMIFYKLVKFYFFTFIKTNKLYTKPFRYCQKLFFATLKFNIGNNVNRKVVQKHSIATNINVKRRKIIKTHIFYQIILKSKPTHTDINYIAQP